MARRAAAFTEADLKRAARVAQSVAPGAWEVDIDRDGKITIRPGKPAEMTDETEWRF